MGDAPILAGNGTFTDFADWTTDFQRPLEAPSNPD